MKLVPTGSQTVGPFFAIGLSDLCAGPPPAEAAIVTIQGRVLDGNNNGVPDAVLEIWQADPQGRYGVSPSAAGFARIAPDEFGQFRFTTCRPGPVPFDETTQQAPHLAVLVFARGLLRHLITRMYFPGEPGNATDPVLQSLPSDRRHTLIAHRAAADPDSVEWDIVLQGENETVFFAW